MRNRERDRETKRQRKTETERYRERQRQRDRERNYPLMMKNFAKTDPDLLIYMKGIASTTGVCLVTLKKSKNATVTGVY